MLKCVDRAGVLDTGRWEFTAPIVLLALGRWCRFECVPALAQVIFCRGAMLFWTPAVAGSWSVQTWVTEDIKGSGSVDLTVVEISRLGWRMSGAEVGSETNKNHLPLLQVQILMVELEHWENMYSQIALYFFNNQQWIFFIWPISSTGAYPSWLGAFSALYTTELQTSWILWWPLIPTALR